MPSPLPQSMREWNLYRAFLSLARTKNFEVAASELGISVVTLRRRIERLEQLAGGKLSDGSNSNFELTGRGKKIYDVVQTAEEGLATLVDRSNTVRLGHTRTPVSIGSANVYFEHFWLPLFEANEGLLDEFIVSFESDEYLDIAALPEQDITISLQSALSPAFTSEAVGAHRITLGAHKNYIAKHGMVTPENIHEHRFVTLAGIAAHPEGKRVTDHISSMTKDTVYVSASDQIIELSKARLGICMTTQWLSVADIIPFEGFLESTAPLYVTYRSDMMKDPSFAKLVDFVLDHAKEFFDGQGGG